MSDCLCRAAGGGSAVQPKRIHREKGPSSHIGPVELKGLLVTGFRNIQGHAPGPRMPPDGASTAL